MDITKKKILIVDDHCVVRQGVVLMIKKYFGNTQIFEASSINEAKKIIKSTDVDYVILDINFPDGNSLNFVESLSIENNSVKILIFSALEESTYAFKFLSVGAHGFLSKLLDEEIFVKALRRFFESGKYLSEDLKDRLLDSISRKKRTNPLELLSSRELEIARLLYSGLSNNDIAYRLNIHKSTVSTYKTRIFEKLGIYSIPSLVNFFNLH